MPAPAAESGAATLRVRLLVGVLLAGAALAAFGPVLDAGFVGIDDKSYVTDNPWVRRGLDGEAVAWALTTGRAANWHPLTWVSHMVDWELWGADPRGHHRTSLLLHLVNTLLVFLVLARATGAAAPSALVAGVFAVHPVNAESVAWIAERKNVLSTTFWWLAISAHLAFARRPSRVRGGLVAAAMAIGLAAKPMLVTLPFVLLLLDVWPLGRASRPLRWRGDGGLRPLVMEKGALFALAAVSSVVTFLVQRHGAAVGSLERFPLGTRLANAVASYGAYLASLVWPDRLAAFYPYPRGGIPAGEVIAAALVVSAVTVFAVRSLRSRPYVAVGWLWFVGTLVPVLGLVQVGDQSRADRYLYVPMIGVLMIIAWGVRDAAEALLRRARGGGRAAVRAVGWGLAIALLAALAARSRVEVRYWRDGATLFERTIAVAGGSVLAHNNAAIALVDAGRREDALAHYEAALELDPRSVVVLTNLGNLLADGGLVDDAVARYREALDLRPDDPDARYNLGVALAKLGRLDEAIGHYEAAIAARPDDAQALNNLGSALARRGRVQEAVVGLERAVRIAPDYGIAHANLAAAYHLLGRAADARRELLEARRLGHEPPSELRRAILGD